MVQERTRGATIGDYVVLDRLVEGSRGDIYRAYKPEAHQRVAIKILDAPDDGRLLDDARALARIAHKNVVAVQEVGTIDDELYIVMDLVEGRTLQKWLRRGRRRWGDVVDAFVGAGRGLAAAHMFGRVHGELDLEHMLIDELACVRVVGFPLGGMRRPIDVSPGYRPPEQYDGLELDERADQFSLCVAMWEGLHGQRPYVGTDLEALHTAIRTGSIDAPPDSPLPVEIDAALRRGLSPAADARWPTLAEMLDVIEIVKEATP